MSSIFSQKFLDDMDESLIEEFLVPSVEETIKPEATDPYTVARQSVGSEVLNQFLTTVIEVAENAEPPTVSSLIKIRETSKHEDRWFFYVHIAALCGEKKVGYGQGELLIEDEWGKNDGGTRLLEVPMKDLAVSLTSVEALRVTIYAEHCKFGWFTGSEKGECKVDISSDASGGEVDELITIEFV